MRVEVVDNKRRKMLDAVSSAIQGSDDLRMAVAFVSRRGLELIGESLATAIGRGVPVELLVGLDFRTTEPRALEELLALSRKHRNVSTYWYGSLRESAVYHPKLYVSRVSERVTYIVGSSNLTEGGLTRNIEVNVLVTAPRDDESVSDIYSTYNQLKFLQERVAPTDALLGSYAAVYEAETTLRRKKNREREVRKLRQAFNEQVKSSRRPKPTRRDLVGWLELVYDSLPEGEFTNSDAYQHEPQFQDRYPENRNIKAKVRQQLQVLEAMGLVKHITTGRWRKL
jgi:HKD family nuclease